MSYDNVKNELLRKIAEKLKRKRKEIGLTQEELAEKTGLGVRTIANYEGMIKEPRISNLVKIADVLGVPLSYFILDLDDIKEKDEKYKYICEKIKKYEVVKNNVYTYIRALFAQDSERIRKIIATLEEFADTVERVKFLPDDDKYIVVIKDGEVLYIPKQEEEEK